MVHLLIQRLFGSPVIGAIGGGNGSGSLVIGRDAQGLMRFGFPAIGKGEGEVGSGTKDIGDSAE
jgi:hypothetical protein